MLIKKYKKNGVRPKLMGKELTVTYVSQDRRLLGHFLWFGES